MRQFFLRLLSAVRPGSAECDLTREMASHLAMLEEACQRRGLSAEDARRAARRAMGSVALAEDWHRDTRSFVWLDDLRTTAFVQVAAYIFTTAAVADASQPPTRVSAALVSAAAFELLGDRPLLGRTFRPDEDRPGGPPVVMLGNDVWSSRYASDPGIIGRSITVNGIPSTVIGVMPRGFMFPALSTVIIRSIAVVALLLALVGLYAVTGHTVERWRRELGLRIALGARTAQIGWLVLTRVLTQLGIGLGLGVIAALAFDPVFNGPARAGTA